MTFWDFRGILNVGTRPEKSRNWETRSKANITWNSLSSSNRRPENQGARLVASGATSLQNIPKSEVNGFDFDATIQILPSVIQDLVLGVGGGFLETEYTDFSNAQGYNEAGIYSDSIEATGGQIYYAPDVTIRGTLSKTWYLFDNPL